VRPNHQIGDIIDARFELVTLLGRGASGTVWKAIDLEPNARDRYVALKLLLDERADDARDLSRFVQEAKLLARFEHPGIARSIAWSERTTDVYVAMELIDGMTLEDLFVARAKGERPFSREEIASRALALTSAIDHAHAEGVVHRDLKPGNIMVEKPGAAPFVKVLDFGIAKKLVGSDIDPTTAGHVLGSILYIAPEQSRGDPVDRRTDIFAIGTILFEMITLRRAWMRGDDGRPHPFQSDRLDNEANGPIAVLRRICREPRPRASLERPDLGQDVDRVLARAMAISPDDRFRTARELQIALEHALESSSATSEGDTVPAKPAGLPSFKKR
jgi:serine/threonine-protein kinase